MVQRCDHTPAWAALAQAYGAQGNSFDLRTAFAADSQRFAGRFPGSPESRIGLSPLLSFLFAMGNFIRRENFLCPGRKFL